MKFIHKYIQDVKSWLSNFDAKEEREEQIKCTQEKTILSPSNVSLASHIPSPLSSDEKISLFMDLFQGRRDVFPKRWDNQKTGKSGYSPACQNEWVRGGCKKPHIKCSDCLNQAFIPVTEKRIQTVCMNLTRRIIGKEFGKGLIFKFTSVIYLSINLKE